MKREENSNIWKKIYEESSFGNKYPSSYFVSLFHRRIKPELARGKSLEDVRVLDFGCSVGANSRFLMDLDMKTYGLDVSEAAIDHILGGVVTRITLRPRIY